MTPDPEQLPLGERARRSAERLLGRSPSTSAPSEAAPSAGHETEIEQLRVELAAQRQEIVQLRAQLKTVRSNATIWQQRLEQPSFKREHHRWVDMGLHYRQDPSPAKKRIGELNRKLWVHAFAASHQIPVPAIIALGQRPEDLHLESMPEALVVKSDGGTASRAVIPLRRTGPDRYDWIGHDPARTLDTAAVIEHFQVARAQGHSYGPVYVEELLHRPDGPGLPDDVKIYVAYGQVLQVLLRRPVIVEGRPVAKVRYVSGTGEDLGKVALWQDATTEIPIPENLDQMVEYARRISLALPMPLCRVDLYETDRGPVLGEITRTPGAPHRYRTDHDQFMGQEWIKAEARLFEDMHQGRPGRPLWGPHATLEMLDQIPGFPGVKTSARDQWLASHEAGTVENPAELGHQG